MAFWCLGLGIGLRLGVVHDALVVGLSPSVGLLSFLFPFVFVGKSVQNLALALAPALTQDPTLTFILTPGPKLNPNPNPDCNPNATRCVNKRDSPSKRRS
jgi:hypothetical protein